MEDRDKSEARKADGDKSIVELTPDMVMPDDSDVRIIDLTDAIDDMSDAAPAASPAPKAPDQPTARRVSTAPAEAPPAQESPENIEMAVDAAFDAVQAPIEEPDPEQPSMEYDDGLLDRLSDLPRKVDQAVEAAGADKSSMEIAADNFSEADEPHDTVDPETAIVAEALDSDPMASDAIDDEDVIPLEEIVEPGGHQGMGIQDDEIIELTDVVDPAELRAAESGRALDDDEIVELTDIVAAAELDADTDWDGLEEELAGIPLSSISPENTPADAGPAHDHGPRQKESVIRLSEVLNQGMPREDTPPIEQIKMGAEEELARQDISLEAEDAAHSLGLDLEKETGQEGKPLTDEEIEAAVERILQTKYAKTIEQLIARTVEKAVSREIENIKRAMLDGDEPPI